MPVGKLDEFDRYGFFGIRRHLFRTWNGKIMPNTKAVLRSSFNVIDQGQTVLIEEAKIAAITKQGFWIKDDSENKFIPRSLISECDTDFDQIMLGEAITFEMPRWKAEELGFLHDQGIC
jgi:hypothetical protein